MGQVLPVGSGGYLPRRVGVLVLSYSVQALSHAPLPTSSNIFYRSPVHVTRSVDDIK